MSLANIPDDVLATEILRHLGVRDRWALGAASASAGRVVNREARRNREKRDREREEITALVHAASEYCKGVMALPSFERFPKANLGVAQHLAGLSGLTTWQRPGVAHVMMFNSERYGAGVHFLAPSAIFMKVYRLARSTSHDQQDADFFSMSDPGMRRRMIAVVVLRDQPRWEIRMLPAWAACQHLIRGIRIGVVSGLGLRYTPKLQVLPR